MVAISTVYSNAHKYLKTEEMQKEFRAYENKYNVSCFVQAQALINMAVNGNATKDPELFEKLKGFYNYVDEKGNVSPFKLIVDKCLDHLVKTYGKEDVQLKDGRVVNGTKYLLNAKRSLSNQKTKAEENTL